MCSSDLLGFRFALPAAVQQRGGQQIGFAQIVQFQLHGRGTLSFVQDLQLCPHGSTGLFRSCCKGDEDCPSFARFVGALPCVRRCGRRFFINRSILVTLLFLQLRNLCCFASTRFYQSLPTCINQKPKIHSCLRPSDDSSK